MGRKAIYTEVYNRLRYQILSGELTIGSPLPPERKLATELGVSRNTIVRAYEELQAEGFIASRVGSGRYVEPLPPDRSLTRINWQDMYRSAPLSAYPSHMADLLSMPVTLEGMVNFAHGDGGKHTWAASGFSSYVKQAAERADAYYFSPVAGNEQLREWIVAHMKCASVHSADQVLVTSGSQEALYLISSLLAKPGDMIVTEMPTYFGSLQLFQSLGLKIIPLPLDQEGMRIDMLEGVLARYRPKFIYTVPTYHNPTGVTLSLARRKRLVSLSEAYQIPVIEDDAYRHLHFADEPPPPLKSLGESGNIIYVNTFSKVLFPGLRIGWIAANRPFIQLCARMKELSIATNTLGQTAVAMYLADGQLEQHLTRVRSMYATQEAAMHHHLSELKRLGLSFHRPSGGFYYWVALPRGLDARIIKQACLERGVAFASGDMFLLRDTIQPFIRLCFSHETTQQIQHGMNILASVLCQRKEQPS